MSPSAVAALVARLFAASGRDFGQTHLEVYAEGLADVSDDLGEAAGKELVRVVSWDCPPSVNLVRQQVLDILRRERRDRAAIPQATGTPTDGRQARMHLAAARGALFRASGPLVEDLQEALGAVG